MVFYKLQIPLLFGNGICEMTFRVFSKIHMVKWLSICDLVGRNGSYEEEIDANDNVVVDPQVDDRELKVQLLHKYNGYLGSLKQEFLKKKKNGKLPKEARQRLLDWWNRHYKWPYPSVSIFNILVELH